MYNAQNPILMNCLYLQYVSNQIQQTTYFCIDICHLAVVWMTQAFVYCLLLKLVSEEIHNGDLVVHLNFSFNVFNIDFSSSEGLKHIWKAVCWFWCFCHEPAALKNFRQNTELIWSLSWFLKMNDKCLWQIASSQKGSCGETFTRNPWARLSLVRSTKLRASCFVLL